MRRLRELYDDEIALKKFEIRKKLNLSADYYPRTSSSVYNEPSSSFSYNKEDNRIDKLRMKSQYPSDLVEDSDGEPLTVISVLRLLAALEDLLGATLGKKVLDLLSKAVHLEKLKANLADDVLMNEENSVLLATVKEKLKGLIIAKIVNNQQMNAVRRAIRNVESIVTVIDDKLARSNTNDTVQSHASDKSHDQNRTDKQQPQQSFNHVRKDDGRSEIREQIATGFLMQKMNISNEQLEELTDIYISHSRETSETPYLFAVRISQNDNDYATNSQNLSSHSHSHTHKSSHIPSLMDAPLTGGSSGFGLNFFDRNAGNTASPDNSSFSVNSGNAINFNRNSSDSYTPQSSNQATNSFRSHDNNQFNQQSTSFNQHTSQQSNSSHNQQRFHQTSSNSLNKHNKKNFNQRIQNQVQIWDSEPMMTNQLNSQASDSKVKINSIWETNPTHNQGSFHQNQQSQYNNFSKYPTQHQPVWDQQNNWNSRHH